MSLEIPCHADTSGPNERAFGIQIRCVHLLRIHVGGVLIRQFVRSVVLFNDRIKQFSKQGVSLFLRCINSVGGVKICDTRVDLVPNTASSSCLLVFELAEKVYCQVFLQEGFHLRPIKCLWKLVLFFTERKKEKLVYSYVMSDVQQQQQQKRQQYLWFLSRANSYSGMTSLRLASYKKRLSSP